MMQTTLYRAGVNDVLNASGERWYNPRISDKYRPYDLVPVVQNIARAGFNLRTSLISRTKTEDRAPFVKWAMTFVKPTPVDLGSGVGLAQDVGYPMLLLVNSGDGTTSLKLIGGFFRSVCTNECVFGSEEFAFVLRHFGNHSLNIPDTVGEFLERLDMARERIRDWRQLELDPYEEATFLADAFQMRWGDKDADFLSQAIQYAGVSVDRRDRSLWGAYNRAQSAIIGGDTYAMGGGGRSRSFRKARPMRDPQKYVRLNRAVWNAAQNTFDTLVLQ